MVEPKYMDDFDVERADCQLAKGFVKGHSHVYLFKHMETDLPRFLG